MTLAVSVGSLSIISRQVLIRLTLALVAITLIAGCSKPPPPVAKPPVEVTTITVAPRDTPVTMEFVAQTESSAAVNIQARLQYDEGYVPYSTVLQAEQDLFPAALDSAQIRVNLLASNVGIYRAMGGGWVTEATHIADQPAAEPEPAAESAPPQD